MSNPEALAVSRAAAMIAADFVLPGKQVGRPVSKTESRAPDAADVHVHLAGVTGLVTLRADPASESLAASAQSTLGIALPASLSHADAGEMRVRWLSPDEFLVSCPLDTVTDVIAGLRAGATGRLAATDVSGGFAVFEISGSAAVDVLAKSTTYDVHARHFPIGRTVSTVFAKTTAVISRIGASRYEIVCRRSFAAYVGRWIGEAAREYGLTVHATEAP